MGRDLLTDTAPQMIDCLLTKRRLLILTIRELGSELVLLKYSGFDAELDSLAIAYRSLAQKYAVLKYSRHEYALAEITRAIRAAKHELWILKRDMILHGVDLWNRSYRDLVHDVRINYVEPRESARRRINDILATLSHDYRVLKEVSQPVEATLKEIGAILHVLSEWRDLPTRRRKLYDRLNDQIFDDDMKLSRAAHEARKYLRKRGNAQSLLVSTDIVFDKASNEINKSGSIPYEEVIMMMITGRAYRSDPVRVFTRHFLEFYKPGSSSQDSSMWLRQLDIIWPFELVSAGTLMLMDEVRYLRRSLTQGYPAWQGLDRESAKTFKESLKQWIFEAGLIRGSMLDTYGELVVIDWMRVQQERKLATLDVPNTIRERGLFTPRKPITASYRRWVNWCRTMGSYHGSYHLLSSTILDCPESDWQRIMELEAQERFSRRYLPADGQKLVAGG